MKSERTVFERANILEIPPFNLIGNQQRLSNSLEALLALSKQ